MPLVVFIYVLVVVYFFPQFGLGRISTTLIIPAGFLISTILNKKKFGRLMNSKPLLIYIIFTLLSLMSISYSLNTSIAVESAFKGLIVLFFSISIFSIGSSSLRLYKTLLVTASLIPILLFFTIIFGEVNLSLIDRDESLMDPNYYGYFSFIGISSLFILKSIKNNLVIRIGIICLILISFFFGIVNASRATFIITILISVLSYSFDIFKSGKSKFKILFSLLFFLLVILSTYIFFTDNLLDQLLFQRFEDLETVESPRQFHARKAIEIGLQNPVFGVGAGNYSVVPKRYEFGSFSHNTFTEVFANFGLIGLSLYSYLQYIIFKRLKNRLRNKHIFKSHFIIQLLIVFFVFQVYSIFYVVYLDTIFMFLFSLILSGLYFFKTDLELKNSK